METIARKDIEKTIKKEYADARKFCETVSGGYYKMMLDTEDGEIWSDVFISEGSYKKYRSDSIIHLDCTAGFGADIEQAFIDDAIYHLKKSGWTII